MSLDEKAGQKAEWEDVCNIKIVAEAIIDGDQSKQVAYADRRNQMDTQQCFQSILLTSIGVFNDNRDYDRVMNMAALPKHDDNGIT